jgi:hypothetical protein
MKTMKIMKLDTTIICVLAICAFVFTSCEDGDTLKPVINLIEPEEGAALRIGSENGVHFEMELSDNEMLKSYKVEIHNNFDDHGHLRSDEETVPFTFDKTWDLSGKKNTYIHHHEIKIPANATPGNYHLMVYCTDAAGNESYVARNIVLSYDAADDDD